ncbi:hypothetical protein LTR66_011183 [Elasticomyces elasticus]|nr:hypothetical protein LTR66_011183 [Elasticomyces elasticus]KAK4987192.1 hypothetical protein LTR50_004793 [Elasticomyces elasticus]
MLRHVATIYPPPARARLFSAIPARSYAHGKNAVNATEDELAAARAWLAAFDAETIPRSIAEISFSRSSGPGGQNVNKVSSKATLRLPLPSLLQLVPKLLHPAIRSSRYCARSSESLVIQADDSRKQNDNVHSCFVKLHNLIMQAGKDAVPGETSEKQMKRVENLQKAENEGRLKMKKMHSSKKGARRGGGGKPDY